MADCSGAHDFPHLPPPYFDMVVENLQGQLGRSWPLFIAYVNLHSREDFSKALPPEPPLVRSFSSLPGGAQPVLGSNVDVIEELADNIFVTWAAQQSAEQLPVELLMQELDYFQVRRPTLKLSIEGLRCWSLAKSQTKYRYVQAAQQQAPHLALVLDMPPLWSSWQHSREEVVEMARNIVAHPRTFNKGVRARIAAMLADDLVHIDKTGAICPSFAKSVTKEQMSLFQSFLASPRDRGRLDPSVIEKCRDASPPRLFGREARFTDTSSFQARMARVATPGGHTLPPLEAGTPRLPKVTVRIF